MARKGKLYKLYNTDFEKASIIQFKKLFLFFKKCFDKFMNVMDDYVRTYFDTCKTKNL